jgi:hypothetical protein
MRPRLALVFAVLTILAGGVLLTPAAFASSVDPSLSR